MKPKHKTFLLIDGIVNLILEVLAKTWRYD